MKYVFPAILREDEDGYYIVFPDLDSCFTQGEDIHDSIEMAEDILCLTLYNMEMDNKSIPVPSKVKDIKTRENETVSLISCDTMEYREYYKGTSVKKTVSIPLWMNEEASAKGINFSALLQDAIEETLGMYSVNDRKSVFKSKKD